MAAVAVAVAVTRTSESATIMNPSSPSTVSTVPLAQPLTNRIRRCMSSKSCLKKIHGSSNSLKRNVSFLQIEIAEFPIEVGDNPSAEGVPISIGWEFDRKDVFDFDDYESTKPTPRMRSELLMPPKIRQDLLFRQGVTATEMLSAVKEGEKIKKSRQNSIRYKKWDNVHWLVEKSKRKLKKVTSLSSMPTSTSSPELLWFHHHHGDDNFDNGPSSNPLDSSYRQEIYFPPQLDDGNDDDYDDDEEEGVNDKQQLSNNENSKDTSTKEDNDDDEGPLSF